MMDDAAIDEAVRVGKAIAIAMLMEGFADTMLRLENEALYELRAATRRATEAATALGRRIVMHARREEW